MATQRNLIRLSAVAEEAAARADAAKQAVRSAKSQLKEARKMLKSAKKAAKQARRKFETASADSTRSIGSRKVAAKKSKKTPVRPPRARSSAVPSKAAQKTVTAKPADLPATENEASKAALASTLV